ncbi:carboxymuconolactone decarboxylase family protein [Sphingomonas soli]|uniref:carboxymuconolactone decarboxylase family protein n=1 Tax=Sphingomonas soli TaxID=266127 RepID=UPI00082F9FDD|nr:hypothetical protein [Sphingomonas soli]
MTDAQRRVHDEIVAGPRGRMVGPLRAVIHNPDLARDWSRLGAQLRYETSLGNRFSELAIIVTARHWASEVEWAIHVGLALDAGLPLALIEAIAAGEAPHFENERDAIVYEYCRQILLHCRVDSAAYAAVRTHWGDVGVVELTALIGYYSMVAMTLNAHEIPAPSDLPTAPMIDGCGRSALPPATNAREHVA